MNPDTSATDNPVTAELPDPGTGVPPGNDPGGAHSKGYGADPDTHTPPLPDPIPLAADPPKGIHVPERDDGVQATGRAAPQPGDKVVSGPS
ncbi:MAG: hypothetical protein K2X82_16825 [Gemmataceae bacterium]|nr:hypothetical protein [Gemmataceae bacterium]